MRKYNRNRWIISSIGADGEQFTVIAENKLDAVKRFCELYDKVFDRWVTDDVFKTIFESWMIIND